MEKLLITDLDLKDKKVLMRVDFNVPLTDADKISDDTRIKAALQSIKYVLDNNGALILMSHLGRPKGKKDPKLSLKIVAKRLSDLLGLDVKMAPDSVGPEVESLAKNLKPKEVLLLENLRFHEAETKPEKDPNFAKSLSSLGDIYINDAFGTAHRKHSSTYTITEYFPKKSLMGFLLKKEISFLGKAIKNPKRPFYAIVGGKKISTKIGVIDSLIEKVDAIFIGGGMSYTFLKALNLSVGKSIYEEDFISEAQKIMKKCDEKKVKLHLPLDIVVADEFNNDAKTEIINTDENIPDNFEGMDIGPKTIKEFSKLLTDAKTILWNGPLGVFEFNNFAIGTNEIAKAISKINCISIVGGGDSIAAINKLGIADKFSHLSTGGGASLAYLEFGTLPGIEALSEKEKRRFRVSY
ncbi:MAG: Bifunctional PGK/TIM [Candidatus Anoxychlamydiales bacterium]|nr:Bifunctional PGK/TIM [Candidatus Anoxychlamydiales bacterium]